MPEGERGAAAATGESSTTLLVDLARVCAGQVISVSRAKVSSDIQNWPPDDIQN